MSHHPLVSIIIPVYNAEKYIKATVNSVLNQTYLEFELILVNDGSTDSSTEICENFTKKDNRVRNFHIKNNGPGNARNYGISVANGEYIQFIDSDDIIEADMVRQLVEKITIEKADAVICGVKKISANSNETIYSLPSRASVGKEINKDFVKLLKQGLAFAPWNKLYKKAIIKENDIKFNTELLNGEDALFNIEYFSYCNKVFIYENPLYMYFHRTGSLTNRLYKDKEKTQLLIYNKLTEFLGDVSDTNVHREVNSYYLMEFSYVIYQNSIIIKNFLDFLKKIKETRKFINSPEFMAVKQNSYPYSLIQSVVLSLSQFKCEPLLILILHILNKLSKRPLYK
jgi:glycosyltransferase involved in cell wall biosynthesis